MCSEVSLKLSLRGVAQALAQKRLSKVPVTESCECVAMKNVYSRLNGRSEAQKRRSKHGSSWTTLLELTKCTFQRQFLHLGSWLLSGCFPFKPKGFSGLPSFWESDSPAAAETRSGGCGPGAAEQCSRAAGPASSSRPARTPEASWTSPGLG